MARKTGRHDRQRKSGTGSLRAGVEPAGVNEMLQIFVCVSVDLVHFFSFTLATHT